MVQICLAFLYQVIFLLLLSYGAKIGIFYKKQPIMCENILKSINFRTLSAVFYSKIIIFAEFVMVNQQVFQCKLGHKFTMCLIVFSVILLKLHFIRCASYLYNNNHWVNVCNVGDIYTFSIQCINRNIIHIL